jgi:hypothetical protein
MAKTTAKKNSMAAVKSSGLEECVYVPDAELMQRLARSSEVETYELVKQDEVLILQKSSMIAQRSGSRRTKSRELGFEPRGHNHGSV